MDYFTTPLDIFSQNITSFNIVAGIVTLLIIAVATNITINMLGFGKSPDFNPDGKVNDNMK
jgi:hypothetical protein